MLRNTVNQLSFYIFFWLYHFFIFLLPSLICRYALTYNRDSNKLVDSEKYTLLWWYRKFLFNSNESRFRVLYKCTESNKIHVSCFIIVWYMFHIELTFMIQAFQVHHELWTIFPFTINFDINYNCYTTGIFWIFQLHCQVNWDDLQILVIDVNFYRWAFVNF